MSSAFYKSIYEDEIKSFGIKKDSLKVAANSVKTTYSYNALKKGTTFLDYNNPPNRCAYLYKYASVHTGLVAKYFLKLMHNKKIRSVLNKKEKVKICCLGGGPGTDIVGIFKAMALAPHYHNKVVEVTVLDICGGWRNSFKRVITNLVAGKVKNVPATFVSAENFKFKLIEVNLLKSLPANVVTILFEADIICMVKFVSAILGSPTSISAIETIGTKLKINAIVLFIDNFHRNVFKPLTDIAGHVGLKIVVGPLLEEFNKESGFCKGLTSAAEKEMFGCLPLNHTKVSVLGFIKVAESCSNGMQQIYIGNDVSLFSNAVDDDEDNSWYTDDEDEPLEILAKQLLVAEQHPASKIMPTLTCDKFTQTYTKYLRTEIPTTQQNSNFNHDSTNELGLLIDSLGDLVSALNKWQQKFRPSSHCCHCYS